MIWQIRKYNNCAQVFWWQNKTQYLLFSTEIGAYHYEANEDVKQSKYEPLTKEIIPYYMERLDAQVKKNGGYLVGGKLTWADLTFVAILDYINFMAKFDITEKHENLQALVKKVLELPKIKAWVEKRPKSEC